MECIFFVKKRSDLKEKIKGLEEENFRLEYVNNYLVVSLQKRDEMLTHLMEENRKLKELTIFLERTMNGLHKTQTLSIRKVIFSLSFKKYSKKLF